MDGWVYMFTVKQANSFLVSTSSVKQIHKKYCRAFKSRKTLQAAAEKFQRSRTNSLLVLTHVQTEHCHIQRSIWCEAHPPSWTISKGIRNNSTEMWLALPEWTIANVQNAAWLFIWSIKGISQPGWPCFEVRCTHELSNRTQTRTNVAFLLLRHSNTNVFKFCLQKNNGAESAIRLHPLLIYISERNPK